MPSIPNLATASKTDPDFPPQCPTVSKPIRRPGQMFQWTVTLEWDLDENNVTRVQLPECFTDRDRTKMLRAFEGGHGSMKVQDDPMEQIVAQIHVGVGAERLLVLQDSVCVVKRIELSASEGTAKVRTLLLVETGRERVAEVCDLIESEVHVVVQSQLGLFQRKADEADDQVNEDGDVVNEADLPPEPDPGNGSPRHRRRSAQPEP